MARIQDVDLPYLEFAEGAAPGTPAANVTRIYVKADGSLYQKTDAGVETNLAAAASGITRTQLGKTAVGASFDHASASGTIFLKKVTAATAGLLASINVYTKTATEGNIANIGGLLRADNAGVPAEHIGFGGGPPTFTDGTDENYNIYISTVGRWLSFPIGKWIAAGDYWIGVLMVPAAVTNLQIAYDAGTPADRTLIPTSEVPRDTETGTAGANQYSFYADFLT